MATYIMYLVLFVIGISFMHWVEFLSLRRQTNGGGGDNVDDSIAFHKERTNDISGGGGDGFLMYV